MKSYENVRVLIISDYVAGWGGNKISGFIELAKKVELCDGFVGFAFPDAARNSAWINEIENPVYFYKDVTLLSVMQMINMAVHAWKVNIIHTHFWGPREIARLKVANRGRCRLIYHIRTFPMHKNDIVRKTFHHMIFCTGLKICISEGIKKVVEYRYSKNNVHVVYNGVDLNRLSVNNCKDVQLDSSGKKILIMGYYFDRKGVDLALRACKKIEGQCEFQLYIITDDSEECTLLCKNSLNSSVMPKWITILPAIENIASYYRSMDIFLSPSRSEAFGMSSIEAAYCGCKVIASKVPGQEEIGVPEVIWISNPETNLDRSIDELAESLKKVIISDDVIEQKEFIRKYIENNFSMDKWVREIIALYRLKGKKSYAKI